MRHIRLRGFQIMRESQGTRHIAPSDFPKDFKAFNDFIGLPISPVTNLPHALTSYQLEVGNYKGKDTIINKSNKIGITEIYLRKYLYRGVVGDCQGYQMMLGAQDRMLAIENMRRLHEMFEDSDQLRPLVKRKITTRLELWNDTTYFVMPRTAKGMRGWPRLKAAFMDEAAHYGLLDDEPIFAATTSRLANTDGYLDIASTPQGQRGFFYRVVTEGVAGRIPVKVWQWDYHVGMQAGLITEEFIEKERLRLGLLFPQEYECAFLRAQNAAIEQGLTESMSEDYVSE